MTRWPPKVRLYTASPSESGSYPRTLGRHRHSDHSITLQKTDRPFGKTRLKARSVWSSRLSREFMRQGSNWVHTREITSHACCL